MAPTRALGRRLRQSGGELFKVAVEVRKRTGPTKKNEIVAFDGIIRDIPGQPKGIFVSKSGYQRGALAFAEVSGITLVRLTNLADVDAKMELTVGSIAKIELIPERLIFRFTAFNTNFVDISLDIDQEWARSLPAENRGRKGVSMHFSKIYFVNGDGKVLFYFEIGSKIL